MKKSEEKKCCKGFAHVKSWQILEGKANLVTTNNKENTEPSKIKVS